MLKVKVEAYSYDALAVLREHMLDSSRWRNRISLRAFGIKQELIGAELFITFGKLLSKIKKKGGSYGGVDTAKYDAFIEAIVKEMNKKKVPPKNYKVIVDE